MMMKSILSLMLSAPLLASCGGIESIPTTPDYAPGQIALGEKQTSMVKNQNAFAWKMLGGVAKEQQGQSLVLSPMSAIYALGMVANGANGSTLSEITGAMGFSGGIDQLNSYCRTMLKECPRIDPTTTLSIANCVELNKDFRLKDDYKTTVSRDFEAKIESRDFSDASFTSDINRWCSQKTNGMIPKMFDEIDPSMSALILNALYFRGLWRNSFDESATYSDKFHAADGQQTDVKMMYQTDDFDYYSDGLMQILSMDYGNGSYSMQVILPAKGKTVDDVLASLQQQSWSNIVNNLTTREVEVHLPRFTVETSQCLNQTLTALGMPTMFTPLADFSRMSDAKLMVSQVLQKAKIEVDENGTKAAAVTGVIMLTSSFNPDGPTVFMANRPFLYAITEHSTSSLLFVGQYMGN